MHIYLETEPDSGVLKYRGETGDNDDPKSFEKKMGEAGLRVQSHDEFRGKEITLTEGN